ncbi:MAG: SH3 domain-containing protein [Candidatus Omnitrophica bacterium]|nr:SH3 domain-containing protein [Candidatus Omnitrophota bacterium]
MRKNAIFMISCFLLCASVVAGAESAGTFQDAIDHYENGEYAKACEVFESLIGGGAMTDNIFYDLGNSYLRIGRIGKAILNYERVLVLSPRDSDALSNLSLARSLMKRRDKNVPENPLRREGTHLLALLSIGEVAVGMWICLLLILSLTFVHKVKRIKVYGGDIYLVALLVLFFSFMGLFRIKIEHFHKTAFIVTPIADMRYGPSEESAIVSPVYDGMKVTILRQDGSWCKIRMNESHQSGWVKTSHIERINFITTRK